MNNKAHDKDRRKVAPYGSFMVRTVQAMLKLPTYGNKTVFRGVKWDLRGEYTEGRRFTWHGFCSTTKSIKVLEYEEFCGQTGPRTFFIIALTQGQARDISRYSLVPSEDEVLLPPGCTFRVTGVLPQGDELTVVQVEELPSRAWLVNLRAAVPEPYVELLKARLVAAEALSLIHI